MVNQPLLHLLVGDSAAITDGASPICKALSQMLGQADERQGPIPQGVHGLMERGKDLSQYIAISVIDVPKQAW